MQVGFYSFYGFARIESPAVDNLNEQLGNSPRLQQPLKFGLQPVMGARLNIWAARQRYAFALGGWSSSSALAGTSQFPDVTGIASLGLVGFDGDMGMRLFPWRPARTSRRSAWWTRIEGHGGLSLGITELSIANRISDAQRETLIDYQYSGTMASIGGRMLLSAKLTDWLMLTLFEGTIKWLHPLQAGASVTDYTVRGRDERSLAQTAVVSSFNEPMVMSTIQWGLEVFF